MRRIGVGLVTMALLAAGCTGDGASSGEDDESGTSAATRTTLDPAWSPAGTEMPEGFVVPEGAHLLGGPVVVPISHEDDGQPTRDPDVTHTFLVVTGDPFAVFDDLVAQSRATGLDMPGSAGACLWDVPPPPDSIASLAPVAGPAPTAEIAGPMCEAVATTDERTVQLLLRGGAGLPTVAEVTTQDSPLAPDLRLSAAEQTRANRRALIGDTPETRADEPPTFLDVDDPVQEGAADLLPDAPDVPDEANSGAALLPTGWCRSDNGPDAADLTVPEGARVLARPVLEVPYGGPGDVALLAVDDAEATLTAVYEEAAGPDGAEGAGGFFGGPPTQVELADGRPVWTASFGVSAGGDVCTLVASPDGSTVLLTVGRG